MSFEVLLLHIIFVPIGMGLFLFLIPKKVKWIREILTILTSAGLFGVSIYIFIFSKVFTIAYNSAPLLNIGNLSITLNLLINPLNGLILVFLTGFGFLITIFSYKFMSEKVRRKEYYIFLLITLGSSVGVIIANHLFIFLIFWELVSVCLYFLITTGTDDAREGATKAFGMIGASDACLLLGIGILWYLSKSLVMQDIVVPLNSWLSYTAYILMMIGALTKAGCMPFHTWIPSAAKGAPAPVMALLPASIDKLLGIYLLLILSTKLFIINGIISMVMMIIGAITIVFAVMMALVQHNLFKLLSYHAVSQVGYMVLGIGTMTPIGIIGGLFHMFNNTIYKSCLFLCGGAVEHKTKTQDLGSLGGLAKAMPVTFITCLFASLAISGVPPFNGFVSKWMIYQGTIENGGFASIIFLFAAMFGSALTLASFIKVLYSVFLGRKSKITTSVKKDVGFSMKLPLIVLGLLCILIGIFYPFVLNNFLIPSSGEYISGTMEITGVWDSVTATILIILGLVIGFIIYLIGSIKKSSRLTNTYTGGEDLEPESARVPGTVFYNTVKEVEPLGTIYKKQEKGWFDPYVWFGKIGGSLTKLLKILHNGRLQLYLSWIFIGIFILLAVNIIRF